MSYLLAILIYHASTSQSNISTDYKGLKNILTNILQHPSK